MIRIIILLILSTQAFSKELTDLDWLATNIFFEARNVTYAYQMFTVGNVVKNRVKKQTYWGNNYKEVITYKCEFSWYCDGLSDNPGDYTKNNQEEYEALVASYVIANYIMKNKVPDNTEGALYYHASTMKPNKFFKKRKFLFDDGFHKFYK